MLNEGSFWYFITVILKATHSNNNIQSDPNFLQIWQKIGSLYFSRSESKLSHSNSDRHQKSNLQKNSEKGWVVNFDRSSATLTTPTTYQNFFGDSLVLVLINGRGRVTWPYTARVTWPNSQFEAVFSALNCDFRLSTTRWRSSFFRGEFYGKK